MHCRRLSRRLSGDTNRYRSCMCRIFCGRALFRQTLVCLEHTTTPERHLESKSRTRSHLNRAKRPLIKQCASGASYILSFVAKAYIDVRFEHTMLEYPIYFLDGCDDEHCRIILCWGWAIQLLTCSHLDDLVGKRAANAGPRPPDPYHKPIMRVHTCFDLEGPSSCSWH